MVIVSGLERMTFEVLRRRARARRRGPLHRQRLGEPPHRRAGRADRRELVHGLLLVSVYAAAANPSCRRCRCCGTSCGPAPARCASRGGSARRTCWRRSTSPSLRNAPALAAARLLGVAVVFRIANRAGARPHARCAVAARAAAVRDEVRAELALQPRPAASRPACPKRRSRSSAMRSSRRPLSPETDDGDRPARGIAADDSRRRPDRAVQGHAPAGRRDAAAARARAFDVQAIVVGALPTWPPDLVEYVRAACARGSRRRARPIACTSSASARTCSTIMKASYVLAAPILQEETFGNVVLEARSVGSAGRDVRPRRAHRAGGARPHRLSLRHPPICRACWPGCVSTSRVPKSARRRARAA